MTGRNMTSLLAVVWPCSATTKPTLVNTEFQALEYTIRPQYVVNV